MIRGGFFINTMNRVLIKHCKIIYILLTVTAPVVYMLVQLHRTSGLFFPPDEFGYWENAARLTGLDWSGSTFMQSYYAKGYSMLLYPLVLFGSSPLLMYKCALVINAVLFGLHSLILPSFIKETSTGSRDKTWMYGAAAAGVFYPAHFVYMNYTIAETLITLLVTLVFFCLAKYENTKEYKYAVFSVIASAGLVSVHFRTIGVIVAAGLTIFLIWNKDRKRPVSMKIPGITAGAAIVVGLALAVSPLRSGYVYLDSQFDRLGRLLTAEGALDIAVGMIGKLFYISVATVGLFFLCIGRIWRRRKESATGLGFLTAFVISTVISAVFFVGGKQIDYLVYGRYTEVFAPLIVGMGLCELYDACGGDESIKNMYNGRFASICSASTAAAAILLVVYALANRMNIYMNDFIIGLAWVFGRSNPLVNQLLVIPALIMVIVLWVLAAVIKGSVGRNGIYVFFAALTALFIVIGIYMSEICVYHFHELDRKDLELFEAVTDMYDDGRQVDFIRPPGVNYIGHLQFYMFDRTIRYIDGPDPEADKTGPQEIVVTYPNYEFYDRLAKRYDTRLESAHFVVFYNDPKRQ